MPNTLQKAFSVLSDGVQYESLITHLTDEENEASPRNAVVLGPVFSDYQECASLLHMPYLECSCCWEIITESGQRDFPE